MKMSYNPDIFCLFTPICLLLYKKPFLEIHAIYWWGGNLSQLVYLAPHPDFLAVIGYGFWIAANCYLQLLMDMFRKMTDTTLLKMIRKTHVLIIQTFTAGFHTHPSSLKIPSTHNGWGGNLSQLVYLAPHPDFLAVIGYGF